MKYLFNVIFLFLLLSSNILADTLSASSISGKWMFTHMNLDGTGDRPVNRAMEFQSDGTIINYDAAGNRNGSATYTIQGDTIRYKDKHGEQKWRVKKFDGSDLQVDNSGAMMFFKRQ